MKVDLQVHTTASPCSRASPDEIASAAVSAGLDGIAVTDHDTMAGVAGVRAAAPDALTVIPGVEVTTSQGHLLALGVDSTPARGDPLSVIDDVHGQGGVAVLSHPFDALREHFDADLEAIAAAVDAVEAVNSRCVRPRYNDRSRAFAAAHDLPIVGGSDAHFPMEVGRAYTRCEGQPLQAVRDGETRAVGRGGYLSGHVATKLHQYAGRLREAGRGRQ